MINSLSNKFSMYLCKRNYITKEDCELYTYGFFILFSNIFFTILILLFGIFFRRIPECLVFHISFRAIRNFAGGYHADTETRCEIFTSLCLFFASFLISLSANQTIQQTVLIASLISIPIILILSPLDTPEKTLDANEKRRYRKISHIIVTLIVSVIIVALYFKITILLVPCCLSLVLESILLILGKIKGHLIATG